MHESIVFVVRVRYRRKESSRSLSHLLTSFLLVWSVHARLEVSTCIVMGAHRIFSRGGQIQRHSQDFLWGALFPQKVDINGRETFGWILVLPRISYA